jgi:uncharacterized membrane protein
VAARHSQHTVVVNLRVRPNWKVAHFMSELSHLREQIALIARNERDFLERRTGSERVGDAIGSSIGSLWFIFIHICWIGAWIAWNSLHAAHRFDPAPFPLLDSIVAIEAIFLASFIVMRQGRLSRRSDERDHLILQILILTEREITAVLGIERQLATRIGMHQVADEETLEQLSQNTPIDEITQKIREHVPES